MLPSTALEAIPPWSIEDCLVGFLNDRSPRPSIFLLPPEKLPLSGHFSQSCLHLLAMLSQSQSILFIKKKSYLPTKYLDLSQVEDIIRMDDLDEVSLDTITIHIVNPMSGDISNSATLVSTSIHFGPFYPACTTPVYPVVDNHQVDVVFVLKGYFPGGWLAFLGCLGRHHRSERGLFLFSRDNE